MRETVTQHINSPHKYDDWRNGDNKIGKLITIIIVVTSN